MKKGLIITAHPDDETIWMGGMILNSKDIDWTIFSLCRKTDPDRAPRFMKVCEHYNAKGMISDLEDEGIMGIEETVPEAKKRIRQEIGSQFFDYIFTHDSNGEYGHDRHIGIHRAVKEMVQGGELLCKKLLFFSYKLENGRMANGDFLNLSLQLDREGLERKKNIIIGLYGFTKNSFEAISCLAKETFYENTHLG